MMSRYWILACALIAGAADAAEQVPGHALRSMFVRALTYVNAALNLDTRGRLLEGSGLTEAEVRSILDAFTVDLETDLRNLDSTVAKMSTQPKADLQSYEDHRRELL